MSRKSGKGLFPGPSSTSVEQASDLLDAGRLRATPRTSAGFIGAWRMRTPVASKNAFATAEPIAVGRRLARAGQHPAVVERVRVALAHVRRRCRPEVGSTVTYSPGWTLTSVTFGASLKRRIGYVTQSRLVIRSLLNVGLLAASPARGPGSRRRSSGSRRAAGSIVIPLFWATYRCLTTILPALHVHLDVGDDADLARGERAEAEAAARSRCCRSAGSSAATFGFQPAAIVARVQDREPACAGASSCRRCSPAERDRVHVRRVRELVHDLLAGEVLTAVRSVPGGSCT